MSCFCHKHILDFAVFERAAEDVVYFLTLLILE